MVSWHLQATRSNLGPRSTPSIIQSRDGFLDEHRLHTWQKRTANREHASRHEFRWSGVLDCWSCPECYKSRLRFEFPHLPLPMTIPPSFRRTHSNAEKYQKTPDDRDLKILYVLPWGRNRLFKLLLGAELVGVAALLLSAVGGTRGETSLGLTSC